MLTSVFYLVPSIWLSKYSSAISSFLKESDAIQLAKAIAYQKSFWKFVGITVLVFIVIAILGVIAATLIPTLLLFQG
jgi:flagellar biosynthesis protein FlhB